MNKAQKQIFGIILLVVIVFLQFRFFPNKSQKQPVQTKTKKEKNEQESIKNLAKLRTNSRINHQNHVILDNEDIRLTLSSQGGKIVGVELKKYKRFDKSKLLLVDPAKSNMQITCTTEEGTKIDLSNLSFTTEVIKNRGNTEVVFTHILNEFESKWVQIRFLLPKRGYTMQCSIITSPNLEVNGRHQVSWVQELPNQDKHIELVRRNTAVHYLNHKGSMRSVEDSRNKEAHVTLNKKSSWFAIKTHHFLQGITSPDGFSAGEIIVIPPKKGNNQAVKTVGIRMVTSGKLQFYFGPNDYYSLRGFAKRFEQNHYLGPRIFRPINTFIILPLSEYLKHYMPNYIWVLLLIILLFSLLQFFFVYRGHINSIRMNAVKPMIEALNHSTKEKVNKDIYTMQMYRKAGANPLQQLPIIFIQIPIFICMINFTRYKIDFRQLSFLWIADIATYDDLLSLPFNIPFIGNFINLMGLIGTFLPILVESIKKKPIEQAETQSRALSYGLPLVFMFVFNTYPVSWWIYRIGSSFIDLCQQAILRFFVNEEAIKADVLSKLAEPDENQPSKSRAQARLQKKIDKKK